MVCVRQSHRVTATAKRAGFSLRVDASGGVRATAGNAVFCFPLSRGPLGRLFRFAILCKKSAELMAVGRVTTGANRLEKSWFVWSGADYRWVRTDRAWVI